MGRFLAVIALDDTFGVSNKATAVNEIGQTDFLLETVADLVESATRGDADMLLK